MSQDFPQVGLEAIIEGLQDFLKGSKSIEKALQGVEKQEKEVEKQSESLTKKITDFGKSSQRAFLGMAAAGAALTAGLGKVTMIAARTQELGVVVDTVGRNIGATTDEMRAYEEGIKGMGITTSASRQSLIQMVQANIDLAHSTDLARLAQDAAVIAQMDSSEAFNRLITGVQRGSLIMLRQLGIQVSFEDAYKRMADELGTVTTALTQQQKQQARVNAVLEAGKNIAGTYQAAMGTAGKQMRSMKRHTEELANELGDILLPLMSKIVQTQTGLLKSLRGISSPVKETAVELAAASAAVLTFGGAAGLVIPKIFGMINALQKLSMAIGIGLGPLGIGAAAVGALVVAITHLKNLEEAQREQAIAVLETSESYEDYVNQLDEAGIKSDALSEELYDVATAAVEAADGIDALAALEAAERIEDIAAASFRLATELTVTGEAMGETADQGVNLERMFKDQVQSATELELAFLADEDAMLALARQYTDTEEQAVDFAAAMNNVARVETRTRKTTKGVIDGYGQLIQQQKEVAETTEEVAASTVTLEDEMKAIHRVHIQAVLDSEALALAYDKVRKAVEAMLKSYESFSSTLATGIIQLRDLDQEAIQSTENYKDAIKDLNREAGEAYADIAEKFQNSLPDATAVSDRAEMIVDAWDEWALRMGALMDGVQGDHEQGWLDTLMQMTAGTDLAFNDQQETIKSWMTRLQAAFYEGDLTGLINEDSQAWKDHEAAVTEAQNKETAAVAAATAEKKRLMREQRQEEKRLAKEAREEALLQISLQLAEESGLLQQWAAQRFGAFAGAADTAGEVFALLDSGLLTMDGTLEQIIGNTAAGVTTALDMTGGQAETTKQQLSDTLATAIELSQQFQTETANLDAAISASEGVKGLLPDEDQAALESGLDSLTGKLDTLKTDFVDNDPFMGMALGFEGAAGKMTEDANTMGDDVNAVFEAIGTTAQEQFDAIIHGWSGGSVVPDMIQGSTMIGRAWGSVMNSMLAKFEHVTGKMEQDFKKRAEKIIQQIRDIITELEKIPTRIEIELVVNDGTAGAGDGESSGGDAGDFATGFASDIGITIGVAIVESIEDGLSGLSKAGSAISGIANFFGGEYQRQRLDPLQARLDEIAREQQMAREAGNMYLFASLEAERLRLLEDQVKQQKKLQLLQERMQQMRFLEQQFKLLELINEYGLDAQDLLQGIELGLGADPAQLLDLTSDILAQIIAAMNAGVSGAGAASLPLLSAATPPVPLLPAPGQTSGSAGASNVFNFGGNNIYDPLFGAAFESNVLRVVRDELRRN